MRIRIFFDTWIPDPSGMAACSILLHFVRRTNKRSCLFVL